MQDSLIWKLNYVWNCDDFFIFFNIPRAFALKMKQLLILSDVDVFRTVVRLLRVLMASLQSSNHGLTGVFWDFLVFGMILLLSAIDINSFIKTSKLDR